MSGTEARAQGGILADLPTHARYLELSVRPGGDPRAVRTMLGDADLAEAVVGIGPTLAAALGAEIEGFDSFPAWHGIGGAMPSTQADVWLWLRGDDRGEIATRAREWVGRFGPRVALTRQVDGFKYDIGRDLSGYVDGTENPDGAEAVRAGLVGAGESVPAGSSFVAVQQWVHDLAHFHTFEPAMRDDIIGRRISDNEEIDEAPESAHVKRTAQESFDPEAFLVRRSMPYADANAEGLMFVAFGHSFAAFEAQLRRMLGLDDGVADALFRFTRPISGSYFWCPPVDGTGRLDLSALD